MGWKKKLSVVQRLGLLEMVRDEANVAFWIEMLIK